MLAAWAPGEARGDSPDVGEWKQLLKSDKAAERGRARRELRQLSPDESDVLAELARDHNVNIRVAAIDTFFAWMRGDDEPRRVAAVAAMKELKHAGEPAASLAAARVERYERAAEQAAIAEIVRPVEPALVIT
jgi:hypothetical protein